MQFMAKKERTRTDGRNEGRLRLLGASAWRQRLRDGLEAGDGLGAGRGAWSARWLPGWGRLFVAATREGLCRIDLGEGREVEGELARAFGAAGSSRSVQRDDELLAPVLDRLAGFLEAPSSVELDLPVDAQGTEFQRATWRALAAIPCGRVLSYKEVAVSVGRPAASRAVGGACGANPVPFVIPCHRVVGSDGRLTGCGLGVAMKERLLAGESGSSLAR